MIDYSEIILRIKAELAGAKNADEALKAIDVSLKDLSNQFKIGLIGEQQFNAGFDAIVRTYQQLDLTRKQSTDTFRKLITTSENAKNGFVSLGGSLKDIQNEVGRFNPMMISFSQGLQDSGMFAQSFGMGVRSVTNNLQMFGQQILYAKTQGYSFGQIIKGMGASMMGPMGALVAFSAITAAIQYFTAETGKAKRETSDLNDELMRLYEGLPKAELAREKATLEARKKERENLLKQLEVESKGLTPEAAEFGAMMGESRASKRLKEQLEYLNKEIKAQETLIKQAEQKEATDRRSGATAEKELSIKYHLQEITKAEYIAALEKIRQENISIGNLEKARELEIKIFDLKKQQVKETISASTVAKAFAGEIYAINTNTQETLSKLIYGYNRDLLGAGNVLGKQDTELKPVQYKGKAPDEIFEENQKNREKGTMAGMMREMQSEFSMAEVAADSLKSAVNGIATGWTNAVHGLISGTQNISQAFKNMGTVVLQELEMIIARMIAMKVLMSVFNVFGFSSASIPTGRINMPTGTSGGTEMYSGQIAPRRSSGYNQLNIQPFVQIVPITNNEGLAVRVAIGNKSRDNKKFGGF